MVTRAVIGRAPSSTGVGTEGENANMDPGGEHVRRKATTNPLLLGCLYSFELCALLLLLTLYRLASKATWLSFFSSLSGVLMVGAVMGLGGSAAIIVHQCYRSRHTRTQKCLLTVVMNFVSVLLLIVVGETTVRLFSVHTPMGVTFGRILLLPRSWDDVAKHLSAWVDKSAAKEAYLVYDSQFGWTVGVNRQNKNGLYSSSAEGLRSSRRGESFAEKPVTCRIALVGDSFTFGEEVAFADSWAYQLEQRLPSGCQVLNFGVRGYGVDQAYLRYMRDVRPWQPHVVIFGFINHDLYRVMSVYGFLLYNNVDSPWAKPRFVYEQGNLFLANVPLPKLEEIIAKKSIRELPFIEYEREYRETEWDRPSWRHFHSSYLFRLLTSLHPLWERERQETSDKNLRSINRELFQSFVKTATSDNTIPLIVYLPYGPDFSETYRPGQVPLGVEILRDAKLAHTDLTACFSTLPPSERFMQALGGGVHYSPKGNAKISQCLYPIVMKHLTPR